MARSKPKTSFYINYGPVTPTGNADALIPVFIAPRYGLHGSEYGDGILPNYTGATFSADWPDRDDNSVIDQTTAAVVFDTPTVVIERADGNALSATASPSVSGGSFYNTVTFTDAVAGVDSVLFGGYQLRSGDKIELVSGSSSAVFGVNAVKYTETAASGTATPINTTSVISGIVSSSETYDNQTKLVYGVYPTAATSDTLTARVVNIAGDPAFPTQSSMVFSNGSAIAVGNMGMTLAFSGSDLTSANTTSGAYLVSLDPGIGATLNTVVLDNDVESALRSATARVYTANIVRGGAEVDAQHIDITADKVTVSAGAKVNYNEATYEVVSCDKVYANYRALLQDGVGEITTGARSDIVSWVGKLNPDNPLGMCYAAAANAGTPDFFLLPVGEDTDDAYIEALQIAGKLELAYSLFPLRQTPAVIAAAKGVVAKYSAPTVAQLKRLWLYAQDKQSTEVTLNGVTTPMASITSNGVLNLDNGAFTGSAVKVGTKVVLHSVYDADKGVTSDVAVTVSEIIDEVSVKVVPSISVPVPAPASFYNELSPSQYAAKIAESAASQNNVRVNYVFAEANTVNGYSFEDARYIVPVLMAMRSAMAPHAPLTDVVIPGVSIGAAVGFSDADYDTMNNGGVWVCYKDNRGDNVTLHAITTGGEGTIAEEDSAVSNGDNIVRFVRNQLSWLKGNCNVSNLLIEKVEVDAIDAIARIQSRDYGPLIGRQILEVNGITVEQDPNNTAGLIGTFNLDLPDVYLDGSFTFNLV